MKTFFGANSKKGLCLFFCKPWAPFFKSNVLAPYLPGLSGILPSSATNQNFGGALAPFPPYTSLIGKSKHETGN